MKSHRCRVLLVDDHDGFREVLRQLLSGYEEVEVIAEARDGEEAIIQVASYQPDVILMDLRMPRMDGVRATTVIKKGRLHTPIIGLCLLHDTYTIEAFLKPEGWPWCRRTGLRIFRDDSPALAGLSP